jgi:hypothetical protein
MTPANQLLIMGQIYPNALTNCATVAHFLQKEANLIALTITNNLILYVIVYTTIAAVTLHYTISKSSLQYIIANSPLRSKPSHSFKITVQSKLSSAGFSLQQQQSQQKPNPQPKDQQRQQQQQPKQSEQVWEQI